MQQDEGKQLGRARDYALLKFVWTYVRPYRRLFFLSVILMPLNSAFALAQPYIIQLIIDLFLAHHRTAPPPWLAAIFKATGGATLMTMAPIYLLLVAGEFATFYGQFYLTVMVAQYSLSDLRLAVFNHVERLPMSFFDRTPVGRLVSRMTTDIDAINDMFASGALTVFVDVMTMTGIVVIMWAKSPHLALWALIAIPPLLLFINLFRVRARVVYRQIRERLAAVNAYLSESLAGMTVIQLFTRERTSRDEFDVLNLRSRDSQMMANIYETGLFAAVDTVASVTIGVILWAGGGEALHRAITIGTLIGFMQYAQMFFMPLREISNKYTALQSALASAERIEQLMEEPFIVSSPAAPKLPTVSRGSILFDHVNFEYRPDEPILKDLSFTVEPGQKIAIVGPTGSGKTTIIKLLNRFYDVQSGRILVDGIDVREWDLRALRRTIGLVQQDVFLFAGDVMENIRLGLTDLSESQVGAALRRAAAGRARRADPRTRREPVGGSAPTAVVRARPRLQPSNPGDG